MLRKRKMKFFHTFFQILTDNSPNEQGLNKVFDLCVVCGDKASGIYFFLSFFFLKVVQFCKSSLTFFWSYITVCMHIHIYLSLSIHARTERIHYSFSRELHKMLLCCPWVGFIVVLHHKFNVFYQISFAFFS